GHGIAETPSSAGYLGQAVAGGRGRGLARGLRGNAGLWTRLLSGLLRPWLLVLPILTGSGRLLLPPLVAVAPSPPTGTAPTGRVDWRGRREPAPFRPDRSP